MFNYSNILEKPFTRDLISFAQKYERHVGIFALIGGFVFDTLTLGGPGELFGTLVLGFYILVSAGSIVTLSFYHRKQKIKPYYKGFESMCYKVNVG